MQAVRHYPPFAVTTLRRLVLVLLLSCGMPRLIQPDGALHWSWVEANSDVEAAASAVHFHSMFGWGDSLTDTGNSLIVTDSLSVPQTVTQPVQGRLPYGETFFGRPVGRFCDGRLLVDLLAEQLGSSAFLEPSLAVQQQQQLVKSDNSSSLVSFAVGGATAMTAEYLNATYNVTPYTVFSLDSQLGWFSRLPISQNEEAMSEALAFFGEIGGNDYNYGFGNRVPFDEILALVPQVVAQLQNALEMVVRSGVKYVVVQGDFPMGCNPLYRRTYANHSRIDEDGCLEDINRVIHTHNAHLGQLVQQLALLHPTVHFIFWDSEAAFMQVYRNPSQYGFAYREQPCYDIADYFLALPVNMTGVEVCQDPSSHIIWDGPHLTEAMNKVLLSLFSSEDYAQPYPNFLSNATLH